MTPRLTPTEALVLLPALGFAGVLALWVVG